MGKLNGKDRKGRKSHIHTNMMLKTGNHKKRRIQMWILEMHQKLRDQKLKTILYIYRLIY